MMSEQGCGSPTLGSNEHPSGGGGSEGRDSSSIHKTAFLKKDDVNNVAGRRRARVQAVCSPPTVFLIQVHMEERWTTPTSPDHDIIIIKPCCSLCGFEEESGGGWKKDDMVNKTVRTLMEQVGVVLKEDLTFCAFCSTQLLNLVKFKRKLDGLGETFVTMIIGLQSLFSAVSSSPSEVRGDDDGGGSFEEEDDDLFEMKPDVSVARVADSQDALNIEEDGSGCDDGDPNSAHSVDTDISIDSTQGDTLEDTLENCSHKLTSPSHVEHIDKQTTSHVKRHSVGESSSMDADKKSDGDTCLDIIKTEPSSKGFVGSKGLRPSSCYNHYTLIHTREKEKPYQCHICSQSFSRKHHLSRHLNTHLPEEDRPYFDCHLCTKRFTRKTTLEYHIKNIHNRELLLEVHGKEKRVPGKCKCYFCGKIRSTEHYRQHLLLHTLERPFWGPKCDARDVHKTDNRGPKQFTTKRTFANTASTLLTVRRHTICPVCNKSFSHPYKLRNHKRVHTGEKPHVCPTCSRRFADKYNLRRHMSTVCHLDDSAFTTVSFSGQKQFIASQRVICPICSKSICNASELRIHKRIHTGEKPHV